MPVSQGFLEFLIDGLDSLGTITSRRMFGGAGIYCDGLMFAVVIDDELYLKVDDTNRRRFEDAGLEAFTYTSKDGRKNTMSYYHAPEDVLDDPDALCDWARVGFEAALRAIKSH